MAEKKEKQYVSDNAQLMAEWDWEKNKDINPTQMTLGSHKKICWKCNNGHEWAASPHHRSHGTGCPYCSGKKIFFGFNDLATLFPNVAMEWNHEKNMPLQANAISPYSNKKVWWKCAKGHEWQTIIAARTSGGGCPYCSNKKVLIGYNDLATTHPQLAAEWHPTKNGQLKPTQITRGAGINIWWKCSLGHEWCTTPNKRTSDGTGCPFCAGKKVKAGFNDLKTTHPRLANEWHPTLNENLTPQDVTFGSGKKVWWKCAKGHEWQASISNRVKNRNCPICSSQTRTSFPEQALYYYLKKCFPDAESQNATAIGMELDVFLPSIKTAIEYDGVYYHQTPFASEREHQKNLSCINNGIRLIRLREKGLNIYTDCECIIVENPSKIQSINQAVENTFKLLGIKNQKIDLINDNSEILDSYLLSENEKSLSQINPQLASEWHPTKNGELKATHLAANSSRIVWWRCSKGHEWQASIHNRAKGKGCPYCSGRIAISGENDILSLNPKLIEEWDYELNQHIDPSKIKPGSNVKVWWICSICGHSWEAAVNNRTAGRGCPKCGEMKKGPKRKTHESFQEELRKINPSIELMNRYVVSTQKIKCHCSKCGHEWYALPGNLLKGKGCPECAKAKRKNTDT